MRGATLNKKGEAMARNYFGAIDKLPSGKYRSRFTPPDGLNVPSKKRISAPHTFDSKRAAESWLAKQKADIDRGAWKHPDEVAKEQARAASNTLGAFAQKWLAAQTWKPSTRRGVESHYKNYIEPAFKDTPLTDITHKDVAEWLENLQEAPSQFNKNRERGKARPNVRRKVLQLLTQILDDAVDQDYLEVNPLRGRKYLTRLTQPQAGETVPTQNRRLWDAPSVHALINGVPERLRLAFLLMAVCGLRNGETSPLRVEDIDLKAGMLHVTHSVTGIGKHLTHSKGAKTAAGVRSIPLAPAMVEEVKAHIKSQGIKGRGAWLFPRPYDETQCVSATTFNKWSKRVCERLGFDGHIRPHELRHAVNTHAQHVTGVAPYDIKAYLGHARGHDITMHYSHTTEKQQRLIADALAALYLNPVENLIQLPKAANND